VSGGKTKTLPALEAPGAESIGIIGLGICCALIAAIMLLDIVSINKHFAFMKKNLNYCRQRIVGAAIFSKNKKKKTSSRQATLAKKPYATLTGETNGVAGLAENVSRAAMSILAKTGESEQKHSNSSSTLGTGRLYLYTYLCTGIDLQVFVHVFYPGRSTHQAVLPLLSPFDRSARAYNTARLWQGDNPIWAYITFP